MKNKKKNLRDFIASELDNLAVQISIGFTEVYERMGKAFTEAYESMNKGFAEVYEKMNEGFTKVQEQINRMDKRFDRLEIMVSDHDRRMNTLEDEVPG